MFKEICDSIGKNLKERITSPFYGSFIVSWCIWNWKVIYITFFVDSSLLLSSKNILKIDYILNLYGWDSIVHAVYSLSHILILPLISSFIVIFWLPRLTCKFYEKSLENENRNKGIKMKKEKEFLEIRGEKLEVEKKIIKKEAEVEIEKEKSEKSQEKIWEEEYKIFKETKYFLEFNKIIESVYEHQGWLEWGELREERISIDLKAFCDVNKITEIFYSTGGSEQIKLTEKGKYFIKKYTESE